MPEWADLNERQRKYLRAVYDMDQAKEAVIRDEAARGRWNSTPASQWRWIPYNAGAQPSYAVSKRPGIAMAELARPSPHWSAGAW